MPFAAFGTLRLLAIAVFIISISSFDASSVSGGFLELFLMGRIPGTDIVMSFEAFFAGAIFVTWAIATYNFTVSAMVRIHDAIAQVGATTVQQDIEEIAL